MSGSSSIQELRSSRPSSRWGRLPSQIGTDSTFQSSSSASSSFLSSSSSPSMSSATASILASLRSSQSSTLRSSALSSTISPSINQAPSVPPPIPSAPTSGSSSAASTEHSTPIHTPSASSSASSSAYSSPCARPPSPPASSVSSESSWNSMTQAWGLHKARERARAIREENTPHHKKWERGIHAADQILGRQPTPVVAAASSLGRAQDEIKKMLQQDGSVASSDPHHAQQRLEYITRSRRVIELMQKQVGEKFEELHAVRMQLTIKTDALTAEQLKFREYKQVAVQAITEHQKKESEWALSRAQLQAKLTKERQARELLKTTLDQERTSTQEHNQLMQARHAAALQEVREEFQRNYKAQLEKEKDRLEDAVKHIKQSQRLELREARLLTEEHMRQLELITEAKLKRVGSVEKERAQKLRQQSLRSMARQRDKHAQQTELLERQSEVYKEQIGVLEEANQVQHLRIRSLVADLVPSSSRAPLVPSSSRAPLVPSSSRAPFVYRADARAEAGSVTHMNLNSDRHQPDQPNQTPRPEQRRGAREEREPSPVCAVGHQGANAANRGSRGADDADDAEDTADADDAGREGQGEFECEFDCGFSGTFGQVQTHEPLCSCRVRQSPRPPPGARTHAQPASL